MRPRLSALYCTDAEGTRALDRQLVSTGPKIDGPGCAFRGGWVGEGQKQARVIRLVVLQLPFVAACRDRSFLCRRRRLHLDPQPQQGVEGVWHTSSKTPISFHGVAAGGGPGDVQ